MSCWQKFIVNFGTKSVSPGLVIFPVFRYWHPCASFHFGLAGKRHIHQGDEILPHLAACSLHLSVRASAERGILKSVMVVRSSPVRVSRLWLPISIYGYRLAAGVRFFQCLNTRIGFLFFVLFSQMNANIPDQTVHLVGLSLLEKYIVCFVLGFLR